MSWINLSAIWKIVVFGLIAGAGLPALFAVGMVSLAKGPGPRPRVPTPMPSSAATWWVLVIAALCFLIVLAAIGWGIYEVYQIGHPAPAPPAK